MGIDNTKIEQAITALVSNLELLDQNMAELKNIKHSILPLQRKIKEINLQISNERQNIQQSPAYITQLCETENQLQQELKSLLSLDSSVKDVMDECIRFIQAHHHKEDLLENISDTDLKIVKDLYQLNTAQSLSKNRETLANYLGTVSDDAIIELINVKFKFTGHKRFYLEDQKIKSKYCDDLKVMLNNFLVAENFKGLVKVIQEIYGPKNKPLKPIQVLEAIITFYNKRKIP